ncbi:MAG: alcohol dehydrogenase catalytic domain-containing protein [bacterium]|nr:MAG: alcohol dehydrogenase catalytic domain-containing protein [bacterium]
MKVAVWYNNRDIRIEEVPRPGTGPDEILVKVISCGICGSDVVEWYRLPRAPLVQGHEVGGEVVEAGASVKGFKPGDRVFIAPKVPCMECPYCRDGHFPVCSLVTERLPGGFAEFILVPRALVEKGTYLLPEGMSYDQSTFIEPLACVVRAWRLAGVREGQTVMVLGCGMSGLLHVKLAKARNCRVVAVDVDAGRLEFAGGIGADETILASGDDAAQPAGGKGAKADVVMLCTSALSAVEEAWAWVDKGGAVVFFAVPDPDRTVTIPVNELWRSEIRVLTSYYCGPPDIVDAMDLLAKGTVTVDDLITHRLALEDIQRGFALVTEGKESIKVIVRPNG